MIAATEMPVRVVSTYGRVALPCFKTALYPCFLLQVLRVQYDLDIICTVRPLVIETGHHILAATTATQRKITAFVPDCKPICEPELKIYTALLRASSVRVELVSVFGYQGRVYFVEGVYEHRLRVSSCTLYFLHKVFWKIFQKISA